jgi:hypothetical protein
MFLQNPDFHGFRNGSTAVGLPFSDASIPSYDSGVRRGVGDRPRRGGMHFHPIVFPPGRRGLTAFGGSVCRPRAGRSRFHPVVFPSFPPDGLRAGMRNLFGQFSSHRFPVGRGRRPYSRGPSFHPIVFPPDPRGRLGPAKFYIHFHPTVVLVGRPPTESRHRPRPFPSHHGFLSNDQCVPVVRVRPLSIPPWFSSNPAEAGQEGTVANAFPSHHGSRRTVFDDLQARAPPFFPSRRVFVGLGPDGPVRCAYLTFPSHRVFVGRAPRWAAVLGVRGFHPTGFLSDRKIQPVITVKADRVSIPSDGKK